MLFPKVLAFALMLVLLLVRPAIGLCDSEQAVLAVEPSTGRIMFQHNADKPHHPASLTKMMTLYILFEALDSAKISLGDRIIFSEKAASEPSMKLGVKAGQYVTVEEAILCLIVLSANDVATAVGEKLGGSEQRFVQYMNKKARQLHMRHTLFKNAHGLHHPEQSTTARDMAKLAIYLRNHFPHYYHYFSQNKFQFRGKTIQGHNAMTLKYVEVDGLKTGYHSAARYNLATSVARGDFSLVAVVMGLQSTQARDSFMDTLINTIAQKKTGQPLTVSPDFTIKKIAATAKATTAKKNTGKKTQTKAQANKQTKKRAAPPPAKKKVPTEKQKV